LLSDPPVPLNSVSSQETVKAAQAAAASQRNTCEFGPQEKRLVKEVAGQAVTAA
jgi:hypothetical protein